MGGMVRNEAGGVNDLGAQKGFGGLLRGCEGAMLCFAVDFWTRGAFCRVLGCWGLLEAAAMLPANQPGLAVPAGGPAPSSPILPAQYHSLACPGCCCLSITPQQIEGLGPIPCNAAPQGGLILDPGGAPVATQPWFISTCTGTGACSGLCGMDLVCSCPVPPLHLSLPPKSALPRAARARPRALRGSGSSILGTNVHQTSPLGQQG